jgi:hypothetical protein
MALCLAASSVGAAELPAPWVEFGADAALSVRAVIAPGNACCRLAGRAIACQ